MLYARLLLLAVIPMALVYYGLSILQLWGIVQYTKAEIKWPQVLIPFYYFFKSAPKDKENNKPKYFG